MRRLESAVDVPLPPERAFALLIEPSAIRAWWGASRAVVVPEVGGPWIAAWGDDEDDPDHVVGSTLAAFEPPHRLRLEEFRYSSRDGGPPFDVRVLATEFTVAARDGGGSTVRVVQDGFPDAADADAFYAACEAGWNATLQGFARVARGEVERSRGGHGAEAAPQVPVLETERLRLRAFRSDDLDDYARFCADPEVMRFLGGETWSRTEAWRHLAMMTGHWALRGFGMWAVERREDGALLGRVGCIEPDGWPGFEIGWTLGREYWGRGYATEAARAALRWAREVLGRERVLHLIADDNQRSAEVAKRLGARPVGEAEVLGHPVVVWESVLD